MIAAGCLAGWLAARWVLTATPVALLSLPAGAGHISSNRDSQLVDSALTPGAGHVPTRGSAESSAPGEAKAAEAAAGEAGGSSAAAQQLKQALSGGSGSRRKKLSRMQTR